MFTLMETFFDNSSIFITITIVVFVTLAVVLHWFGDTPKVHPSDNKKFRDFVIQSCPSLRAYNPTPWLFNGHLQTVYAALVSHPIEVEYERHIVGMPDGGKIAIDVYPSLDKLSRTYDTIVFLHGLTGGSHESYIRSIVLKSINEDGTYKFRSVVIHSRGCGDSPVETPQLFCGAYTNDIRALVNGWIKETMGNSKIVLVGFSLGANILVNYLGEEGVCLRGRENICGAISVANPYDMQICSIQIHKGWFNNKLYSENLVLGLVKLYEKHEKKLITCLPPEKIKASKNLRDFDEKFTRRQFRYRSVDDYYREASSARKITSVEIPLICLSARDDPIAVDDAIPIRDCAVNSNTLLITTSHGGHVAWYEGFVNPSRWTDRSVPELANALFKLEKN